MHKLVDSDHRIGYDEAERSRARADSCPRPQIIEDLNPCSGAPGHKADEYNVESGTDDHQTCQTRIEVTIDGRSKDNRYGTEPRSDGLETERCCVRNLR